MSIPTDLMLDPDRNCLHPTRGDPKPEQAPDTTFKVPYPCNSHKALKATHAGLFQPIPRRLPPLYQPWLQTQTSPWTKPQTLSIFREHQRAWEERRERKTLYYGWDNPHYHSPFSGNRRANYPPGINPEHFNHLLKWKPVPPETEIDYGAGIRHRWEASMLREHLSLNAERLNIGRHRGPYMKRRDKQVNYSHTGSISHAPFNANRRSHPYAEDRGRQAELMCKQSTTGLGERPRSRCRSSSPSAGDSLNHEVTFTAVPEDAAAEPRVLLPQRPPAPSSTSSTTNSSSSSSPAAVPWLLPHFAAGSLIELRDGRLRKVEDLKTEDFLLGSLACPQLRLSCCTVQDISPSATDASFSHLLILLHDQHSQESVDVYAEYPFFVRGEGWSSCSPQGTTRLCGLQCRQLSVGDVCLALTPVSPNGFP